MTSKEAVLELIKLLKENHYEIVNKDVEVKTIKGYPLDRIIKDLEILELIKVKSIAVGFIDMLIKMQLGGVNEYNDYIGYERFYLTKQEFDLLKEWLER